MYNIFAPSLGLGTRAPTPRAPKRVARYAATLRDSAIQKANPSFAEAFALKWVMRERGRPPPPRWRYCCDPQVSRASIHYQFSSVGVLLVQGSQNESHKESGVMHPEGFDPSTAGS